MASLATRSMHTVRVECAVAGDFLGVRLGGRGRVERMMLLRRYTIAVLW